VRVFLPVTIRDVKRTEDQAISYRRVSGYQPSNNGNARSNETCFT